MIIQKIQLQVPSVTTSHLDPGLAILNLWALSCSGILPTWERTWSPESLHKRHIPLWGHWTMVWIQSHTLLKVQEGKQADGVKEAFTPGPIFALLPLLAGQGQDSPLPSSSEESTHRPPFLSDAASLRSLGTAGSHLFWVSFFVPIALGPLEPGVSPPRSYPLGELPTRTENGPWE